MYFKGRGIPMTVADVLNSEGGRPLTPEIDEVEWGCNHGRRQGQEVGRERVVIGDQRIIY